VAVVVLAWVGQMSMVAEEPTSEEEIML